MPKLLTTPFASEATSEYRTDVQNSTGAEPNSATYEQGFPPVTMEKIAMGGKPPKGSDLNGIFYDITDNLVALTKGARYVFNEAYATAIGGYPLGAVLRLDNGVEVESEVDANSINPNVDMTGWKLAVSDNGIVTWSGRTQEQKNKESPSMLDFKAVGDGVTDDTQAYLDAIEFSKETGILVEGLGKTYFTTTRGSRLNALKNAKILVNTGVTVTFDSSGTMYINDPKKDWRNGIGLYNSVVLGGAMPKGNGWNTGIALGAGTLANATQGASDVLIGQGIMVECTDDTMPKMNVAIGSSALTKAINDGSSDYAGGRNVAISSLAGHFITSGYMNVFIGRNSGSNYTTGHQNTAVGYRALYGGEAPIGWSGGIELGIGTGGGRFNTALGNSALEYCAGVDNVGIGNSAGLNLKSATRNIVLGSGAGLSLDIYRSYENTLFTKDLNIKGTYVVSGSTMTITLASLPEIGLTQGYTVKLSVTSGELQAEGVFVKVLSTSGNIITVEHTKTGVTSGSGDVVLQMVTSTVTDVVADSSDRNVIAGTNAARAQPKMFQSVILGDSAYQGTDVKLALSNYKADRACYGTVVVGYRTAFDYGGTLRGCTLLGAQAGRTLIDGTSDTLLTNSTMIGSGAQVSGSNQVQLGNSSTTTYVYGTVQNRSDKRDKADIRDTELGLEFINSLRPVDYKWDMREDYVENEAYFEDEWQVYPFSDTIDSSDIGLETKVEDGVRYILRKVEKMRTIKHEKDGSKKRERFHHGFIAQEVGALGADFGGFQDHKINGGADVLSLGYDEFIAPLVKAVQELSKEVDNLKKKLESK